MKFPILLLFVVFFSACKDQAPDRLKELMKQDQQTATYTKFEEITPATPVPAKFKLGLGQLLAMALFKKQSLKYEIVPKEEYNEIEKEIMQFYQHPGLQKSLRLLTYARQIKSGHPYRINPFVPFATTRSENALIEQMSVGPAAVVSDLFALKGDFQGEIIYRDGDVNRQADVRFSSKSLPLSGLMFLMNHEVFKLSELLEKPELNILQDVIIHEFTHIWHNEMLDEKTRMKQSLESNKTEVGHDTQIVSNPHLAFSEGLAEAFEALYGTAASKIMNMTDEERRLFFGNFGAEISKSLEFLANRQTYIRRNSYVYNLYDFKDCTLRAVNAYDSDEAGAVKTLERLMASERFDAEAAKKALSWLNFEDRFYGEGGRVSTADLKKNCKVDSPNRLGAKEGFVATVFYNILYSGALVDSHELEKEYVAKNKKGFEAFAQWDQLTNESSTRSIANADRQARNERIFLLGFRKLVEAMIQSKAGTLKDLIEYMLSNDGHLDSDQRVRVAYQVMTVSIGSLINGEKELASYFADAATVARNRTKIYQELVRLDHEGRIHEVIAKLDRLPPVYVAYESKISGSKKRLNINAAHHIDLIEMFEGNHHRIKQLAARLDRGEGFESAEDFVSFAATFGEDGRAQLLLLEAQKAIDELKGGQDSFRFKDLVNHSL